MNKKSMKEAAWFPMAVAICIGVVLYILLSRFPGIWAGVCKFFGYFKPLIMGIVIAYIMNPLANVFERHLTFVKEKRRRSVANILTFVVVIIFLIFVMLILLPQLVKSMQLFASNLDNYAATVANLMESWGLYTDTFNLEELLESSESILSAGMDYLLENMETILWASASAGKNIFNWGIAFIMSIYLLGEKKRLIAGLNRLTRALLGQDKYAALCLFLGKCDKICSRYIVYNLIDSVIVGGVNAIFMNVAGMEYAGLISVIVAITNLIPTFGPLIGAVLGAFVLFMVQPMDALIFLVFTMVLQTLDGYVIKPKLFGDSLGVSGLWILVAVIVGGNMFGILGILVAVPGIAILDLIYGSYLVPWLEKRRSMREMNPLPAEEASKDAGEQT